MLDSGIVRLFPSGYLIDLVLLRLMCSGEIVLYLENVDDIDETLKCYFASPSGKQMCLHYLAYLQHRGNVLITKITVVFEI